MRFGLCLGSFSSFFFFFFFFGKGGEGYGKLGQGTGMVLCDYDDSSHC